MNTTTIAQRQWKKVVPGVYGRKSPTVVVTARLVLLGGNPDAYFSITVDVRAGGHSIGGGADHELAVQVAPELAQYVKWHLCRPTEGPTHYVENALYWAGHKGWCDGKKGSPPNEKHLKSTIIYGAVGTDKYVAPMDITSGALSEWLTARKPGLLDAFRRDLDTLFGEGWRAEYNRVMAARRP